jgi:FSR family fosmidomycin resistance protein-like MFS transporter
MASGGRLGFAQAFFQVGGNTGSSLGPLLAAFIVLPFGRRSVQWFSIAALTAMVILFNVGRWYREHDVARIAPRAGGGSQAVAHTLSPRLVRRSLVVLMALVFS